MDNFDLVTLNSAFNLIGEANFYFGFVFGFCSILLLYLFYVLIDEFIKRRKKK